VKAMSVSSTHIAVSASNHLRRRFMVEFRYRTDEVTEQPSVTLDAFLDQSNATAVRLEPDDDARALIPFLDRLTLIEVAFPKYRDGRGYSSARILREAGYTGELRAQGDVLVDQIAFMRRCGFDSFAPEASLNPEAVARALSTYDPFYQKAADSAVPVWKLRHG
jgi:uncharacterized protein (DUF934 family)